MCGGVSGAGGGGGGGGGGAAKLQANAQDRGGAKQSAAKGAEDASVALPPELLQFMQYLQTRGVGAS